MSRLPMKTDTNYFQCIVNTKNAMAWGVILARAKPFGTKQQEMFNKPPYISIKGFRIRIAFTSDLLRVRLIQS